MLQGHPHRPILRIKVDDQVVADGLRAAALALGQGDGEGVGIRELTDLHRDGGCQQWHGDEWHGHQWHGDQCTRIESRRVERWELSLSEFAGL